MTRGNGDQQASDEAVIGHYLEDFSRERGFAEHTRSNITQAVNIYRWCQSEFTNVDIEFFIDVTLGST